MTSTEFSQASPQPHAPSLLQTLFTDACMLFEDRDGDGFFDCLNLRVLCEPGFHDAREWAELLNLNAVLALQSLRLERPLLLVQNAPGVWNGPSLKLAACSRKAPYPAELVRTGPCSLELRGFSSQFRAELLRLLRRPLTFPQHSNAWSRICLSEPGAAVFSLQDRNGVTSSELRRDLARDLASKASPSSGPAADFDLLDPDPALFRDKPDVGREKALNLFIQLDSDCLSPQLGLALNDLVLNCVMQATAIRLPLAGVQGLPSAEGLLIRVREQDADPGDPPLLLETDPASGKTALLARGRGQTLASALQAWTALVLHPSDPGQAGARRGLQEVQDILQGRGRWGLWAHCLTAALLNGRPLPPASRMEMARLEHTLNVLGQPGLRLECPAPLARQITWPGEAQQISEVIAALGPGRGELQGLVLVSKPLAVRQSLKTELEDQLRRKGYTPALQVLNAYKAGLSWLLEVVAPALQAGPPPDSLVLSYQPFFGPDNALEMRSRWLQEIFPGPDLLAAALDWPPDRIRLQEDPEQSPVYRLQAKDAHGTLRQWEFSPRWRRIPYLANSPELGTVHPCCAGLILTQAGRILVNRDLPTDRDRFWSRFQEDWLPELEAGMRSRLDTLDQSTAGRPFWEEICIEVCLQETDLRLDLDEERIAPMEALHEDLYFVLLDFFKHFAKENQLPDTLHLGKILPRVRADGSGRPPRASLRAHPMPWFAAPPETTRGASPATGFRSDPNGFELVFSSPAPRNEQQTLCRIARAWGHALEPAPCSERLRLCRPHGAESPQASEEAAFNGPPPTDRFLPAKEVRSWIAGLGQKPAIAAFVAGQSLQGREIQTLEITSPGLQGQGLVSPARLRLFKNTLLINARHHANEISSTNAVLDLARDLAGTSWGQEILKRLNLICIPLENADGVATLEDLLPDGPDSKLHAARYNAYGVEWYADYFAAEPQFPESRIKARLWKRWLPRIVLDCHGIPSHEWEQPYAGYAPGAFRSYWLPRAFVYAIVPFLDDPAHPGHESARCLAGHLKQAVGAKAWMQAWNKRFQDRYGRYARSRDPEVFQAASPDTLTVLPPEKRIQGNNFGQRYWPLTWTEIVSEVTDEIASGNLLADCVRAHRTIAETLMDFLRRHPPRVELVSVFESQQETWAWRRIDPEPSMQARKGLPDPAAM